MSVHNEAREYKALGAHVQEIRLTGTGLAGQNILERIRAKLVESPEAGGTERAKLLAALGLGVVL